MEIRVINTVKLAKKYLVPGQVVSVTKAQAPAVEALLAKGAVVLAEAGSAAAKPAPAPEPEKAG